MNEDKFHLKMVGQCGGCGDIPLEFFIASGARGIGDVLPVVFQPCPTCINFEIEKRMGASKSAIQKKLDEVQADERLSYPTATIRENAPLALEQLALETWRSALHWVLKTMEESNG